MTTEMARPAPSLTLILAATPALGIGYQNGLPWPMLRKEMAYFARVTKRVVPGRDSVLGEKRMVNAVVMGRKTWESIPERLRPLRGRVNVVVSRGGVEGVVGTKGERGAQEEEGGRRERGIEGPVVVGSIHEAVERLQAFGTSTASSHVQTSSSSTSGTASELESQYSIAHTFVIGGATIYTATLALPQTKHVLLTRINKEFECDTFFPVDLETDRNWRRVGREEMGGFVGEEVGEQEEEGGVGFEFCLFERVGGEGRGD